MSVCVWGEEGEGGEGGGHVRRFSRGPLPVFPWEAIVSSSGMGRDVHSLTPFKSISSADHGVAHPHGAEADLYSSVPDTPTTRRW